MTKDVRPRTTSPLATTMKPRCRNPRRESFGFHIPGRVTAENAKMVVQDERILEHTRTRGCSPQPHDRGLVRGVVSLKTTRRKIRGIGTQRTRETRKRFRKWRMFLRDLTTLEDIRDIIKLKILDLGDTETNRTSA